MGTNFSITESFGDNLAELLSEKIVTVAKHFPAGKYIQRIKLECVDKSYTQRIELHARVLRDLLSSDYKQALETLLSILGEENPNETGMFKEYYWIMPIGKFVELFGLDHYDLSIYALEEVTKRNTSEYAIRPYIRKYPVKTVKVMRQWAQSDNFHLRRLASEGLRPKLPWAPKLDTFIDEPKPVFELLEFLKEDPIKFVQKSVGNHLTDYLKVNPDPTWKLIDRWSKSDNKHTQWIIKRATRKIKRL